MLEYYSPVIRSAPAGVALAARRPDPSGMRLLVVCNEKPRAHALLTAVAGAVAGLVGDVEITFSCKPAASHMLGLEEARVMAHGRTHVITGVGDCGSCSACSLHDAIQFERLGVPATVVISSVFTGHVGSFAEHMGAAGYRVATVPHPVSSRSDDELEAIAAEVAPGVVACLTTDRQGTTV